MHLGILVDGSLAVLTVHWLKDSTVSVSSDSCVSNSYRGTYGDFRLYTPDATCSSLASTTEHASQPISWDESVDELVWVNEVPLAAHLSYLRQDVPSIDDIAEYLSASGLPTYEASTSLRNVKDDKEHSNPSKSFRVLQSTETSALLAMPAQRLHDLHSLLPPIWNAYSVPQATALGPYLPVPEPAVDRVREMLEELQYSQAVADAVDAVSIVQLRSDIRWLAGEDEDSPIVSRHSFAGGSRYAASWMKDIVETTGATCEVQPFLIGFAPNLICRYPAATNTTATVVLGAHYDSRGSFGSPRAPGADDNGSGTVGVLSIARLIGSKGIEFKSNVELALFAGEEQGLLGSKHYAKQLREVNKNVTFMLQADSVAYRTPGTQSQLGLPDLIGTPEAAQLVGNISNLYAPELHVGYTPGMLQRPPGSSITFYRNINSALPSIQSFHEQGFPATWIYESAGPVIDPMYHNSGDLSDRIGYDFNQLRSAVKVMFATILHTARFDITVPPLNAVEPLAQQPFGRETGTDGNV